MHQGLAAETRSGWQLKHDVIAAAALVLFARDGYERTSVDAIADEAGVSKRTVYSHYGAKENLFLLVLRDTYDTMLERVSDIADRNLRDADDVPAALTKCLREIVRTITHSPERAPLLRLLIAEAPHFPAILDLWHNRSIVPLIAEPLAKLAASGLLDTDDPVLAAEHLSALTFGQVNNKSVMGTVQLTDCETDRIITTGIAAFLRAYPPPADPRPPRQHGHPSRTTRPSLPCPPRPSQAQLGTGLARRLPPPEFGLSALPRNRTDHSSHCNTIGPSRLDVQVRPPAVIS